MFRSSTVSIAMIAVLLGGVPAFAQCDGPPADPNIPDGATASIEAMKDASKAVETYAAQMNVYADCLIDSAQRAIDRRNETVQRWNQEIDRFNARLSTN